MYTKRWRQVSQKQCTGYSNHEIPTMTNYNIYQCLHTTDVRANMAKVLIARSYVLTVLKLLALYG